MSTTWLADKSPAFRLAMATSWLARGAHWDMQLTAIREAIKSNPGWAEYLRLVDRHCIRALSWAALSQTPDAEIPEFTIGELKKRSDSCRMDAVNQCMLLASVLKSFQAEAIPVMPFKGVLLSFQLYNDVGLRQARDLDLAVAWGDLGRARVCLEKNGWSLDPTSWFPLTAGQWERVMRHEHHLEYVHTQTGTALELHWRDEWETREQSEARWDRSIPSAWQGCSIQKMSPGDLTLYLCSHGGHHAWCRAKWLGDLAAAQDAGLLDWDAALSEARRTGQEAVLQVGAAMLANAYGMEVSNLKTQPSQAQSATLIQLPLASLADPQDPIAPGAPGWARYRLRMGRYEKLLHTRKPLWDSISRLLYGRLDFQTLSLPDSLCWAYGPLHPFLVITRRLRRH